MSQRLHPSLPSKSGILANWITFWFLPSQPTGLHVIRVGFGLLALVWMLSFAGYVHDFFGFDGWFDRAAIVERATLLKSQEIVDDQSWSLLYLVADQPALLTAVFWASVAVVAAFTLGFFTRITSVLTWLIVISFTANPFIEVDTDVFFRIISFYLMIGYLFLDLQNASLPAWQRYTSATNHWLGTTLRHGETPSSAATVAIRLLQVHFALAVVIMGLHKLQSAEWWAGVSYWYPMHRASETSLDAINELRNRSTSYLNFISIAGYIVLAWQIFFPTFAWRGGLCRWVLLGGALVGLVGLMIIYPIPLLGPTFFLLCLSYLTDREWFWVLSPLLRLVKR